VRYAGFGKDISPVDWWFVLDANRTVGYNTIALAAEIQP